MHSLFGSERLEFPSETWRDYHPDDEEWERRRNGERPWRFGGWLKELSE